MSSATRMLAEDMNDYAWEQAGEKLAVIAYNAVTYMYENGMGDEEIADYLGITDEVLTLVNNCEISSGSLKSRLFVIANNAFCYMYEQGMTKEEVAEYVNADIESIDAIDEANMIEFYEKAS